MKFLSLLLFLTSYLILISALPNPPSLPSSSLSKDDQLKTLQIKALKQGLTKQEWKQFKKSMARYKRKQEQEEIERVGIYKKLSEDHRYSAEDREHFRKMDKVLKEFY